MCGGMALLSMQPKQTQSLPRAFSSFSVCSNEVPAFVAICPVGRRYPQQSSRWATHSFNLTKCSAEWPSLQAGFTDRPVLPSLSAIFLFCRQIHPCESQDHWKPQGQVSATTSMKTNRTGKRRRTIYICSPSLRATRVN